jgi:hypothetical protein
MAYVLNMYIFNIVMSSVTCFKPQEPGLIELTETKICYSENLD